MAKFSRDSSASAIPQGAITPNILRDTRPMVIPGFTPELQQLCDDFLEQTVTFASKFAKLSGVPQETAPTLEGLITARCAEALTQARVAAIGMKRS